MVQGWRIVVRQTGGTEVLEREDFALANPGPGEVLIEQRAIGLNFIDTYHRSGLYPVETPFSPGSEAAGTVLAVGDGVDGFAAGDRVGYPHSKPGAYATHRIMPADRLVALPDAVSFETAAAVLLKGCTVEMLAERVARVREGQWTLVHAASGGVGSLLVPWLKAIGAKVIAHGGTAEKAAKAKAAGADVALSCAMDALAAAVREATGGAGVATVFDGVGKASWAASLGSLAKRGLLVSFGNASGSAPPFEVLDLMRGGSLFVTRPTLADYAATPDDLRHSTARVFAMLGEGAIKAEIGQTFALADVAEAHRALEGRRTTGSTVLIP